VTRNLAAAVRVGLALPILGRAGYAANTPQAPEVLFTLRIVYSLVTSLLGVPAFAIALAYPIERARNAATREGIRARHAGGVARLRPGRILGATS
jgi:Na+/melibiose symporter-like transporter